jgi:hypothetical protein
MVHIDFERGEAAAEMRAGASYAHSVLALDAITPVDSAIRC